MQVQTKPEEIGRCEFGRRIYCDGSRGLIDDEWLARRAAERNPSSSGECDCATDNSQKHQ
jgi:hypothetical protein